MSETRGEFILRIKQGRILASKSLPSVAEELLYVVQSARFCEFYKSRVQQYPNVSIFIFYVSIGLSLFIVECNSRSIRGINEL